MDNRPNSISIYKYCYGADIMILKKWIDKQVDDGAKQIDLEIDWGYYDDIDGLDLVAT